MLSTTITDYPFDWEGAHPEVCIAYNTNVHSTTEYSLMYVWKGGSLTNSIGPQPCELSTVNTYAYNSHKVLEESFNRIHVHLSVGH